jgi:hypothetical protein
MEAEGRQFHRVDGRNESLFLILSDDTLRLRQAREARSCEQIRLHSGHDHPFPTRRPSGLARSFDRLTTLLLIECLVVLYLFAP